MTERTENLWIDAPDDLADTGAPRRRSRVTVDASRHIGCPLSWFRLVLSVVRSQNELAVALYLYRLRAIHRSRTVVVTNERLMAELGVNRFTKYRTLERLAKAGIITIKRRGKDATKVVFKQQ